MKKFFVPFLLSLSLLLAGFGHAGSAMHIPLSHHEDMGGHSVDTSSAHKACEEPCETKTPADCCAGVIFHCENNLLGSSLVFNDPSKMSEISDFHVRHAQRLGISQAFDPPPPKA